MPFFLLVACGLLIASLVLPSSLGLAADPFWGADPAWSLIHEPAVERELRLSPAKSRDFRRLLDECDAGFFPLRNRPPEEAAKGVTEAMAQLTKKLQVLLSEPQFRRLTEIQTRQQGTAALLRPGLSSRLDYTPKQAEELEQAVSETLAKTKELEKRAADGEPREPLEKQYTAIKQDELKKVTRILSAAQKSNWQKSLGRDFDLSKLGQARFKAPELVDSGEWLNSEKPLTLESLAGKVVVLHFYAFGCINCIRNFPTYVGWQERFLGKDVVIIGIHTPETAAEQDSASVRAKADGAGFKFPVLIDGKKANWNAWGNSMWPSVYLIDKRGYLRHFWPGELKWQGATGDVWMREKIDELLSEPAAP
jgi:thiol-disulfide isomerase/thioredoxin